MSLARRFSPPVLRLLLLIGLALAALARPVRAQINTNGTFESPGFTASPDYYKYLASNLGTATLIPGWTNTWDGAGAAPSYWMKAGGPYDTNIGAGSYGVLLDSHNVLSTTFSVVTGETYAVSFLAKAGVVLASGALQATVNGQSATFTPGTAAFATYSYNFTANTTGSVGLSFQLTGGHIALDNVSVSAIPEPSTYAAIFGATALGLAAWRRRRAPAVVPPGTNSAA